MQSINPSVKFEGLVWKPCYSRTSILGLKLKKTFGEAKGLIVQREDIKSEKMWDVLGSNSLSILFSIIFFYHIMECSLSSNGGRHSWMNHIKILCIFVCGLLSFCVLWLLCLYHSFCMHNKVVLEPWLKIIRKVLVEDG